MTTAVKAAPRQSVRARKPNERFTVPVHTKVTREQARRIDNLAAQRGTTRTELVRSFVCLGLDEPEWTVAERLLLEQMLQVDEMLRFVLERIYSPEDMPRFDAAIRTRAAARARALVDIAVPNGLEGGA